VIRIALDIDEHILSFPRKRGGDPHILEIEEN
jgi:hypothetical protein